jgi:hypothetical protein
MNYFQQYETERKPFQVGKRFICVDPSAIGQFSDTYGEIVRIISVLEDYYNFRCLSGKFARGEYSVLKENFRAAYQPYIGEILQEEEDNE